MYSYLETTIFLGLICLIGSIGKDWDHLSTLRGNDGWLIVAYLN